jgi:MFS family permease
MGFLLLGAGIGVGLGAVLGGAVPSVSSSAGAAASVGVPMGALGSSPSYRQKFPSADTRWVGLVEVGETSWVLKWPGASWLTLERVWAVRDFRLFGRLAPASQLVAAHRPLRHDGLAVAAGEPVELADYVHPNPAPARALSEWYGPADALLDRVIDQLAINLVPNARVGNLEGVKPDNVVIDAAGRAYQVDFSRAVRVLRTRFGTSEERDESLHAWLLRLLAGRPDIYGRLGEDEVVAQLRELLAHRDLLLATALTDGVRQFTLDDHVWAAGVVVAADAGDSEPLGPELTDALQDAREVAARRGLGDPSRRADYLRQAARRAAQIAPAVRPLPGHIEHLTGAGLLRRLDQGHALTAHDYDETTHRWTVTVHGGRTIRTSTWLTAVLRWLGAKRRTAADVVAEASSPAAGSVRPGRLWALAWIRAGTVTRQRGPPWRRVRDALTGRALPGWVVTAVVVAGVALVGLLAVWHGVAAESGVATMSAAGLVPFGRQSLLGSSVGWVRLPHGSTASTEDRELVERLADPKHHRPIGHRDFPWWHVPGVYEFKGVYENEIRVGWREARGGGLSPSLVARAAADWLIFDRSTQSLKKLRKIRPRRDRKRGLSWQLRQLTREILDPSTGLPITAGARRVDGTWQLYGQNGRDFVVALSVALLREWFGFAADEAARWGFKVEWVLSEADSSYPHEPRPPDRAYHEIESLWRTGNVEVLARLRNGQWPLEQGLPYAPALRKLAEGALSIAEAISAGFTLHGSRRDLHYPSGFERLELEDASGGAELELWISFHPGYGSSWWSELGERMAEVRRPLVEAGFGEDPFGPLVGVWRASDGPQVDTDTGRWQMSGVSGGRRIYLAGKLVSPGQRWFKLSKVVVSDPSIPRQVDLAELRGRAAAAGVVAQAATQDAAEAAALGFLLAGAVGDALAAAEAAAGDHDDIAANAQRGIAADLAAQLEAARGGFRAASDHGVEVVGGLLGYYAGAVDGLEGLLRRHGSGLVAARTWPTELDRAMLLVRRASLAGAVLDALRLAPGPLDPLSPAVLSRVRANSPLGYLLARSLGTRVEPPDYSWTFAHAPDDVSVWDIRNRDELDIGEDWWLHRSYGETRDVIVGDVDPGQPDHVDPGPVPLPIDVALGVTGLSTIWRRLVESRYRVWRDGLDPSQRAVISDHALTRRVISYLDYRALHAGTPPVHDPELDEQGEHLIIAVDRWPGGPPRWVIHWVHMFELPLELREAIVRVGPVTTTGRRLTPGDVVETATVTLVWDESSPHSTVPEMTTSEETGDLWVRFEYLTTATAWPLEKHRSVPGVYELSYGLVPSGHRMVVTELHPSTDTTPLRVVFVQESLLLGARRSARDVMPAGEDRLGIEDNPDRDGGPARLSGQDLTAEQRRALRPLLDPAAAVEVLTVEQVAELRGLAVEELREAGSRGLVVIPGFTQRAYDLIAAADPHGDDVDDLVSYTDAASGLEFTGPEAVAGQRTGRLDVVALRRYGRHERDELENARRPAHERLPHEQLTELPDLRPLLDVLPTATVHDELTQELAARLAGDRELMRTVLAQLRARGVPDNIVTGFGLYWGSDGTPLSPIDVAKRLGIRHNTLGAHFRKYGLPTRTLSEARKNRRKPSYDERASTEYDPDFEQRYSKEAVRESLWELAVELGRPPASGDWSASRRQPTLKLVIDMFGSWPKALEAVGLPPLTHGYTVGQLLAEMAAAAVDLEIDPRTLSRRDYARWREHQRAGIPTDQAIRGRFGGSWSAARSTLLALLEDSGRTVQQLASTAPSRMPLTAPPARQRPPPASPADQHRDRRQGIRLVATQNRAIVDQVMPRVVAQWRNGLQGEQIAETLGLDPPLVAMALAKGVSPREFADRRTARASNLDDPTSPRPGDSGSSRRNTTGDTGQRYSAIALLALVMPLLGGGVTVADALTAVGVVVGGIVVVAGWMAIRAVARGWTENGPPAEVGLIDAAVTAVRSMAARVSAGALRGWMIRAAMWLGRLVLAATAAVAAVVLPTATAAYGARHPATGGWLAGDGHVLATLATAGALAAAVLVNIRGVWRGTSRTALNIAVDTGAWLAERAVSAWAWVVLSWSDTVEGLRLAGIWPVSVRYGLIAVGAAVSAWAGPADLDRFNRLAGRARQAIARLRRLLGAPKRGPPHAFAVTRTGAPAEPGERERAVLAELRDEGAVTAAESEELGVASPASKWLALGLELRLVDGLHERLAEAGSELLVIYLVDPDTKEVFVDRAFFEDWVRSLSEPTRRFMEDHELAHATHPDPHHHESDIWKHYPRQVRRELAVLARRVLSGRHLSRLRTAQEMNLTGPVVGFLEIERIEKRESSLLRLLSALFGSRRSRTVVEVSSFYLDPKFQGHGYGSALFRAALSIPGVNRREMIVSTATNSHGHKIIYPALGFRPTNKKIPDWTSPPADAPLEIRLPQSLMRRPSTSTGPSSAIPPGSYILAQDPNNSAELAAIVRIYQHAWVPAYAGLAIHRHTDQPLTREEREQFVRGDFTRRYRERWSAPAGPGVTRLLIYATTPPPGPADLDRYIQLADQARQAITRSRRLLAAPKHGPPHALATTTALRRWAARVITVVSMRTSGERSGFGLAHVRAWLPRNRRLRRWERRLAGWAAIEPNPIEDWASARSAVLVAWLLPESADGVGRSSWELWDSPELARARLQAARRRIRFGDVMAKDLEGLADQRIGLLVRRGVDHGGRARFGPGPELADLAARAPQVLVTALRRDAQRVMATLGHSPRRLNGLSEAERALVVFGVLRDAVAIEQAARRGWGDRLGRHWGGRAARVRALVEPMRVLAEDVARGERRMAVLTRLMRADSAALAVPGSTGTWHAVITQPSRRALARARLRLARSAAKRLGLPTAQDQQDLHERLAGWARMVIAESERVEPTKEASRWAGERALARGVLDGFSERHLSSAISRAVEGRRRFLAAVVGAHNGAANEAAWIYLVLPATIGAVVGRDAQWVTFTGAAVNAGAALAGLGLAALGQRPIRTMSVIVAAGMAGALGMILLGSGAGVWAFVASMLMMNAWDLSAGLARGRMEIYHPISEALPRGVAVWKDRRDGRLNTAYKILQYAVAFGLIQGSAHLGVRVSAIGAGAVFLGLVGLVWALLRGQSTFSVATRARANPRERVTQLARWMLATPHGLARAVFSIPTFAVFTGFLFYALGGGMSQTMVMLNTGVATPAAAALALTVVQLIYRVPGLFTTLNWPWLKRLLGTPGAWRHPFDHPGTPAVDEAHLEGRLVQAVALLATLLVLPPAVWWAFSPGLAPFAALLGLGALAVIWARLPLNRWMEGPTGATLINIVKTFTVGAGAFIGARTLGDVATRATQAAARRAGQHPPRALAQAGDLRIAALSVPVLTATLAIAWGVRRYHIAPIDTLRALLPDHFRTTIMHELDRRGARTIGAAKALRASGRAPAVRALPGRSRRLLADEIKLPSTHLTYLDGALAQFPDPGTGLLARSVLTGTLVGSVASIATLMTTNLTAIGLALAVGGAPAGALVAAIVGETAARAGRTVVWAPRRGVRRAVRPRRHGARSGGDTSPDRDDQGGPLALRELTPAEELALRAVLPGLRARRRLGLLAAGPGIRGPPFRLVSAEELRGGLIEYARTHPEVNPNELAGVVVADSIGADRYFVDHWWSRLPRRLRREAIAHEVNDHPVGGPRDPNHLAHTLEFSNKVRAWNIRTWTIAMSGAPITQVDGLDVYRARFDDGQVVLVTGPDGQGWRDVDDQQGSTPGGTAEEDTAEVRAQPVTRPTDARSRSPPRGVEASDEHGLGGDFGVAEPHALLGAPEHAPLAGVDINEGPGVGAGQQRRSVFGQQRELSSSRHAAGHHGGGGFSRPRQTQPAAPVSSPELANPVPGRDAPNGVWRATALVAVVVVVAVLGVVAAASGALPDVPALLGGHEAHVQAAGGFVGLPGILGWLKRKFMAGGSAIQRPGTGAAAAVVGDANDLGENPPQPRTRRPARSPGSLVTHYTFTGTDTDTADRDRNPGDSPTDSSGKTQRRVGATTEATAVSGTVVLGVTDPREHGRGWRYAMVPLSTRGVSLRRLLGHESRVVRATPEDLFVLDPDRVSERHGSDPDENRNMDHKPVLIDERHPPEHAGLIVAMPAEHLYLASSWNAQTGQTTSDTGDSLMAEERRMGAPVYLNSTFGPGVEIVGVIIPQVRAADGSMAPISAWDAEWLQRFAAERGLPVVEGPAREREGQTVELGSDGWRVQAPVNQFGEGGVYPLTGDAAFRSSETGYRTGLLMHPGQLGKALEDLKTAGVRDEELRTIADDFESYMDRNERPRVTLRPSDADPALYEVVALTFRPQDWADHSYGRYEQQATITAEGAYNGRVQSDRWEDVVEAIHPEETSELIAAAKREYPDLADQIDALYQKVRTVNALAWAHEQRIGGQIPEGVIQVADQYAGEPIDWRTAQAAASRATVIGLAHALQPVHDAGIPITFVTDNDVFTVPPPTGEQPIEGPVTALPQLAAGNETDGSAGPDGDTDLSSDDDGGFALRELTEPEEHSLQAVLPGLIMARRATQAAGESGEFVWFSTTQLRGRLAEYAKNHPDVSIDPDELASIVLGYSINPAKYFAMEWWEILPADLHRELVLHEIQTHPGHEHLDSESHEQQAQPLRFRIFSLIASGRARQRLEDSGLPAFAAMSVVTASLESAAIQQQQHSGSALPLRGSSAAPTRNSPGQNTLPSPQHTSNNHLVGGSRRAGVTSTPAITATARGARSPSGIDGALAGRNLRTAEHAGLGEGLPRLAAIPVDPRVSGVSERGPPVSRVSPAELASWLDGYYQRAPGGSGLSGTDTVADVAAYTVDGQIYLIAPLEGELLRAVVDYERRFRVQGPGDEDERRHIEDQLRTQIWGQPRDRPATDLPTDHYRETRLDGIATAASAAMAGLSGWLRARQGQVPGLHVGRPGRGRSFAALGVRNFRWYFAGQVVSQVGAVMQLVAQDVLVLRLGGGTALGLVVALQAVPVLFGMRAGALADRHDPRRILWFTTAAEMVIALALGLLDLTGHLALWQVYPLAFTTGALATLARPAGQVFINRLVAPELRNNARLLNPVLFEAAALVGAPLAGLLINVLGFGWAFLSNAASFVGPLIALGLINTGALFPAELEPRAQVREALRYVRDRPVLAGALAVAFLVPAFGENFRVTLPLLANKAFGGGAGSYGMLSGALAAGGLVGALWLARQHDRPRLRLVLRAALVFGLTQLVAGWMPGITAAVVVLAVTGIAVTIFESASAANVYASVEPGLLGRIAALRLLLAQTGNLVGAPLFGWLGDQLGGRWPTVIAGGGAAVVALAAMPTLRRTIRTRSTARSRQGRGIRGSRALRDAWARRAPPWLPARRRRPGGPARTSQQGMSDGQTITTEQVLDRLLPRVAAGLLRAGGWPVGRARERDLLMWESIPAGVPGLGGAAWLEAWRLLSWVWLERNHGVRGLGSDDPATPGVSATELIELINQSAPGAPAWARIAAIHLARERAGDRIDVAAMLRALARHGLLAAAAHEGVERYRPGGALGRLLARAPPAAVAALLRNPAHTVGADFGALTPAEQAHAIHSWLRETAQARDSLARRLGRMLGVRGGIGVVVGVAVWALSHGHPANTALASMFPLVGSATFRLGPIRAGLARRVARATRATRAAGSAMGTRIRAAGSGRGPSRRDFRLFWGGQFVSDIGSAVSVTLIPLYALTALGASAFQVGLLTFVAYAGRVVAGFAAGVVADRMDKRRLLMGINVLQLGLAASIPLAAAAGLATLPRLYVVNGVNALLGVVFTVAADAYLPVLVGAGRGALAETNAKLGSSAFALFSYLGAPTAPLAGASGTWLGPRTTLAIAAIAYAVTPLILVFSPLRGARDLPDAERAVKARTLNRLATAIGAVDTRIARVPVLAWQVSKIPTRHRLLGRLRAVRGEIESLSSEPGLDTGQLYGFVARTDQVVDDLNALLTSAPSRGPPSQAPRQPWAVAAAVGTTAGRWAPRVLQDDPSCWPGVRRSPWPRSRGPPRSVRSANRPTHPALTRRNRDARSINADVDPLRRVRQPGYGGPPTAPAELGTDHRAQLHRGGAAGVAGRAVVPHRLTGGPGRPGGLGSQARDGSGARHGRAGADGSGQP